MDTVPANASLPTINAFWIGQRLGPMHAACLASFARAGHRVVLHTFDPPPVDVPRGIELADASRLMPADRIICHAASGSLALAADIFRFELLAAGLGVYVDCDCYCVRPVPDAEHIFGWESGGVLGVGVLKLPPGSPVVRDMRTIGSARAFIPPWISSRKQRRMRVRAAFGMPVSIADMPWGVMGPTGFTYFAKKHGIADLAQAVDVFYPVSHLHADLLRDPEIRISEITTHRTHVVHLWNEIQRAWTAPPPGSFLHAITKGADSGLSARG